MIGTEGYSPPEQYRGVAEPRGDIYALGATMHHLLTDSDPRTRDPIHLSRTPAAQASTRIFRPGWKRSSCGRWNTNRAPLVERR